MVNSSKIREQIINTFRAELNEHVQTLNDGLLLIEHKKLDGTELIAVIDPIFRAAHSLKGAARAVGVTAVEQLAHALEDILGLMQKESLELTTELFSCCYKAVDAIVEVQKAYEKGETAPPIAVLRSLSELEIFRQPSQKTTSISHKNQAAEETNQNISQWKDTDDSNAWYHEHLEKVETTKSSDTDYDQTFPVDMANQSTGPIGISEETVRVSTSKLDNLVEQLSELLVTKIRAEKRLEQARITQDFLAGWQKEWIKQRPIFSRLNRHDIGELTDSKANNHSGDLKSLFEYVETNQNRLKTMNNQVNTLVRDYYHDVNQLTLVIDGLSEEIKKVRMLPFNTITASFGRMVRDLALSTGKEANLEILGGDVEIDKRVLEQIKDPIIHILRNGVDHGIETPEKRIKDNKPSVGKIILSVENDGSEVIIRITDDGAGINIAALKKTATKRGIEIDASLSDRKLAEMVYNPGFSTNQIITDVSGRGIGLDIVRKNIESLQGKIDLEWKEGIGTSFIIKIPIALASSRALLVCISDQLFAIPLNSIERIKFIRPSEIESVGGHDTIRYNDRPLELAHLSDVLDLPRTANMDDQFLPIVILGVGDRLMGFVVDELNVEQEITIKRLGKQLSRVAGITAASIMGNGEVLLILNVADLFKLHHRGNKHKVLYGSENASLERSAILQKHILVVDDSITTRTLEKNILEASGYIVELATDGLEAFELVMKGELPDLIISDVSMPRLDGIGLTTKIKTTPRTEKIPVILVTSLDSAEDKARGIECGADAYILKGTFNQNNLLETIEQLI